MTNPVHLLSVAALLLVAFLLGATVGTLVRLLVLRLTRKPAATVAAAVEAAPAATPLVATPVVAPLPITPVPAAPPHAEVPVPDFAATLIALAEESPPPAFIEAAKLRTEPASTLQPLPERRAIPAIAPPPAVEAAAAASMQPARVAGETTSGVQVAAPLHENPPEPVDVPAEPLEQRFAEVIPFPAVALEPQTEPPTDIVVGGEAGAVVDTFGELVETEAAPEVAPVVEAMPEPTAASLMAAEDDFLVVGEEDFSMPEATVVPAAAPDKEADTIPVPAIAADAAIATVVTAELPVPEVVVAPAAVELPADAQPSLAVEPIAEISATAEPIAEPPPATTPEPEPIVVSLDEPLDEDAAMRAIEGGWTPRRSPPTRPARPVAPPEGANQAVAASARAVTAARRMAEAIVADVAAEAGRPAGLEGPRDGRKDDLTHIIGVLPVIETALNTLGIYHFDQVGELSDANIGWIEGHLGVPGRIGRELWREQARELSAVPKPKRAAES